MKLKIGRHVNIVKIPVFVLYVATLCYGDIHNMLAMLQLGQLTSNCTSVIGNHQMKNKYHYIQ